MANKPFEIQSTALSINGVTLDTSAQGKLVIPGVTRAGTSVAIEVNDTADQTTTWTDVPVVIDGYEYASLNGDLTAQVGWQAAVYQVDAIDGEGYIDGISIVNGGAGYTGEAVTYSQVMYAAPTGTVTYPFNAGDWTQIPFAVRCGAGEIVSEFGGGGGSGLVQREVNFPYGAEGDTAGTLAQTPGGTLYVCTQDYVAPEPTIIDAVFDYPVGGSAPGTVGASFDLSAQENSDLNNFLAGRGLDSRYWSVSVDGGDTWIATTGVGYHYTDNPPTFSLAWTSETAPQPGDTITVKYLLPSVKIWKQADTGYLKTLSNILTSGSNLNGGEGSAYIGNNDVDLWTYNNTDNSLAEVWIRNNDTSAPRVDINVYAAGQANNEKTWSFKHDGGIHFPDGTTQTTAYTGQGGGGSSGPLYLMANVDGTIITSNDGITWSDPIASGVNPIGKCDIHNGVIVYTRNDFEEDLATQTGLYYSTVLGTATLCTGTDQFNGHDAHWNEVQYFADTATWVSVGYAYNGTYRYPIWAYSSNGIAWTVMALDPATHQNSWFTDVAYNSTQSVYVLVGIFNGPGYFGAWVTADITAQMTDGQNLVQVNLNAQAIRQINTGFGGPSTMFIADANTTTWWNVSPDVTNPNNWYKDGDGVGGWLEGTFKDYLGYIPNISEMTTNGNVMIVTTNDGQVLVQPNAPFTFVKVPAPFTFTVTGITSANPAVVTVAGPTPAGRTERITISGSSVVEYNGTFFMNGSTGELYLDSAASTPFDASGLSAFTGTATITYSHGVYLDAAGAGESALFVGNDNNQVFRSTDNGSTWTQVLDVTGLYFNDFAYGLFGQANVSQLTNNGYVLSLDGQGHTNLPGNLTFPDGTVQTTAFTGANTGLWVAAGANDPGTFNIASSTNGRDWVVRTQPSNGWFIDKVAISPDKIVYVASDNNSNTSGLFYASSPNENPTLATGTNLYLGNSVDYNEINYLGGYFVAVGSYRTTATVQPVINAVYLYPSAGDTVKIDLAPTEFNFDGRSITISNAVNTGLNGSWNLQHMEGDDPWVYSVVGLTSTNSDFTGATVSPFPDQYFDTPLFTYSQDGVNWSWGSLDPAYISEVLGGTYSKAKIGDVAYNGAVYLLTVEDFRYGYPDGSNAGGTGPGAFLTNSLGVQLGSSQFTSALPGRFNNIAAYGDGAWWASDDEATVWHATNATGTWTSYDVRLTVVNAYGYTPSPNVIDSATAGRVGAQEMFVATTNDGQVIYSTDQGVTFGISVVDPIINTATQANRGTETALNFNLQPQDNEKITITVASGDDTRWNGTYWVQAWPAEGPPYFQLFDGPNGNPIDSTGWNDLNNPVTITFSHGSDLGAIGIGQNKVVVYSGQSNKLYTSEDCITWTSQVAGGIGDIYFNADINVGVTGNFEFSGDTVSNPNGMTLITDRGTLTMGTNMEGPGAPAHFHIAFQNSNITPPQGDLFLGDDYNNICVGGTHGLFNQNISIQTNNRVTQTESTKNWVFDTDGVLFFPDNTGQRTAFKSFNKSWSKFIGDGQNDAGTENDFVGQIRMTAICALYDGTVVVGGKWNGDGRSILFQYDQDGKELWRWMDTWSNGSGAAGGKITAINWDFGTGKLSVAVQGTWGFGGSTTASTRVFRFTKHPENTESWNLWTIDNPTGSDSVNVRDVDQTGEVYVDWMFGLNGQLVVMGETWGEKFEAYSGPAGTGSGVGIINIPVASITPYNNVKPTIDDFNGWYIGYDNGSGFQTWDLNWNDLDRFVNVPYTTNGAGTGATFQVYKHRATNTYEVQLSGQGSMWVDGETVTMLGTDLGGASPANDLTFTIAWDGYGGIGAIVSPTGTADGTYLRVNFYDWFGDQTNHSTTGYTYVIGKRIGSEAFIINNNDGYNKRLSTENYGRFSAGFYNADQDAVFVGGESYTHNNTQSFNLMRLDRGGNIVWNKAMANYESGVRAMTDTGKSIWTVDFFGLIMEFDYNGNVLFQSRLNNGLYFDYGPVSIKYVQGYVYVSGYCYCPWAGQDHIRVEKWDTRAKEQVWVRHIQNRWANFNWDNNREKFMDANSEGVFLTGYSYASSNDHYRTGFLIKLDSLLPSDESIDYNDNKQYWDHGWHIYDHVAGVPVRQYRETVNNSMEPRTQDQWLDSTVVYNGGEGQASTYPRFSIRQATLDSTGFNFNDGTGELHHNPAYVPPVEVDFGNHGYSYTLKLSDAGKFLRTIPQDNSNVTVVIPDESQVNFPIGTVITLVNMTDINNAGAWIYITAGTDNVNNYDGYNHPLLYGPGQSGKYNSWKFGGRGVATIMKVGRNEWLMSSNILSN